MKSSYHWQLVENPCLIYKMRVFLYYYFYSHTGKKHITKHRKILYSSIIQRGNFFLEKKDKTPFTYI